MGKSDLHDLHEFLGRLTQDLQMNSPLHVTRKQAIQLLERQNKGADVRLLFEDWEKILRKPIMIGNWSAFYSVYADAIILEQIPDWSQIERAVDIRRSNLEVELSGIVRSLSATEFCTFLANLLSRVNWASAIRVTKQSRDGGLDFQGQFVYHDGGKVPLFGQAKHWKEKVGGEPIRTFIGSVVQEAGGKACLGLYASTGGFTSVAEREFGRSPFKILHYDLPGLVKLMIESNVGVKSVRLESPQLDGSFWDEIAA